MDESIDIKLLRLQSMIPGSSVSEVPISQSSKPPRHKQGEKFLKGPIPLNWLIIAARQPGRALHVALALWYMAGLKRSREIALSIKWLSNLGVSRFAGYRGLTSLEEAGLVSVIRHRGRKPRITLLDAPSDLPTQVGLSHKAQESEV